MAMKIKKRKFSKAKLTLYTILIALILSVIAITINEWFTNLFPEKIGTRLLILTFALFLTSTISGISINTMWSRLINRL
ncbi:MAG: hypothetical protein Q8P20_07895 [bacterium]|nr:hypothetical protein [bacterium]